MLFLITGVAGFIGSRLAHTLLKGGHEVVGLDNLNTYYTGALKRARLDTLRAQPGFSFDEVDLSRPDAVLALPRRDEVDRVVHLAAQAGVRYSLEAPFAYADANLTGHLAVLEFCRHAARRPLLAYASSSSVYGDATPVPFREDAIVDKPVSLYAATKRADELMSETYAHLYGLPQIGMRFFTVYGPWGRPDMAYWSFTDRILKGLPIRVFNGGRMRRECTYIDDAIAGVRAIAEGDAEFSGLDRPHKIYNIGHNQPVALLDFISEIERATGCSADKRMEPMQPGDVTETCADISRLQSDYAYQPQTSLRDGIGQFVDWFRTQDAARFSLPADG